MVTTTPAVACAYFNRDGKLRNSLLSKTPLQPLRSQVRRGSNNTKGKLVMMTAERSQQLIALCQALIQSQSYSVMKMA